MAVFTLPGPAVPGLAIPGDFSPGNPGAATAIYVFTGEYQCCYPQYLGPGGTLVASPGQQFTGSISVASGCPYHLAVPPADGRWQGAGSRPVYAAVLHHPHEDYQAVLARGRAHTAALHAAWASGLVPPGEPLPA